MRDDLTNKLIHLTKGVGEDKSKHRGEGLLTLTKILRSQKLLGGNGFIKGGYTCICFSEAPIAKLSYLLALNDSDSYKYQPYGIMVDKKWLYQQGARPVIYGPDPDFDRLPEEMKYRHVRFWLSDRYSVDHTSEREWRIRTDELPIDKAQVTVVVADRDAKEALCKSGFDKWHYAVLSDLGVDVPHL